MPNLFIDSPNKQDKYSESKLEAMLLEFLFRYEDRKSIFNKTRSLFEQEELWDLNKLKFPHSKWLRTTVKKIHANIETKSFKEHADEHYGKKSNNEYEHWLSLDMKNFPDDFTIGNLKNSGKVDDIVGKTSIETKKILNKRYELSREYRDKIEEQIYDSSKVEVKMSKKSANIHEVILTLPAKIKIEKEEIFEDNNIEYRVEDLNIEEEYIESAIKKEVSTPDWLQISGDFKTDPTNAERRLIDLFWKKENITIPDEIWNPYVNYELIVAIIIPVPITFKPKGSTQLIKITMQSIYDAKKELRVSKEAASGKYNTVRDTYLSTVKDKLDWIRDMSDDMNETTEEE